MEELEKSIKQFIEKETQSGNFSVLNNSSVSVKTIMQILQNYQKESRIKPVEENEVLPRKGELIFVAAPTGAGKDSLVARICHRNPDKKYVELNMDMFRYYFPDFIENKNDLTDKNFAKSTNQFSYEIFYTIQEMLLRRFPGTNIIITGTLRETDWVEETFERFKSDKKTEYRVKIACLAVPEKESAISIIQRYVGSVHAQKEKLEECAGTIRYTSLEYHDETFKRFPKNLEYFLRKFEEEPGKLIDSIEVHRRSKNVCDLEEDTEIYSSDNRDPENIGTALDSVRRLRETPYKVEYGFFELLVRRIMDNKEYLKSQKTLREVVRDLAVILEYPDIIKRIDEMTPDKKSDVVK